MSRRKNYCPDDGQITDDALTVLTLLLNQPSTYQPSLKRLHADLSISFHRIENALVELKEFEYLQLIRTTTKAIIWRIEYDEDRKVIRHDFVGS
jgi:hypothetical protein